MKLICPHCTKEFEPATVLDGNTKCPDCGGWAVLPVVGVPARSRAYNPRQEKIRRNGDILSNIGGTFAVLGMIVGLLSLWAWKSGESSLDGLIFFGCATFIGLWFYLIGQIVHIRANTEK